MVSLHPGFAGEKPVVVVTLLIPARYIHTVNETVATADVDRCVTLLTRYLAVAHTRDYAEDI